MPIRETNNDPDPEVIALNALAWVLADGGRADRLLAMTGLDADALRNRIGDPLALAAVLGFVEAHEPDLIACADAVGVAPVAIVGARALLEK